jgi:hypothetical protein
MVGTCAEIKKMLDQFSSHKNSTRQTFCPQEELPRTRVLNIVLMRTTVLFDIFINCGCSSRK